MTTNKIELNDQYYFTVTHYPTRQKGQFMASLHKYTPKARYSKSKEVAYTFAETEDAANAWILKTTKASFAAQQKMVIEKRRASNAKKEAIKNAQVNVGDIYYTSWGYEQTNIDFYQVVEVKGSKFTFQEISSEDVEQTSWCSARCRPVKDSFGTQKFNCIVNVDGSGKPYFKIDGEYASLTNTSETKNRSWGH